MDATQTNDTPKTAGLEALLAAQKKTNDLLEQQLARTSSAGAGGVPPVVGAAQKDGNGGASSVSVRQRLAVSRVDVYQGKGLGLARVMRGHAIAAREKAYHRLDSIEREMGIPEGLLKAFDDAQVQKAYDTGGEAGLKRAMSDSNVSSGGALAFDEYAVEYIEVLRARLALLKAGVVDIPMDRQSLTIGRQTSDVAGAWMGEDSDLNISTPGTDTVQLQLKKWGCLVPISNDLLHDAVAADIIVRNSLMASAERALDLAGIRGSGTQFTPRGIRYWAVSGNVFSSAAGAGSNTLTTVLTDLATARRVVDQANVPTIKPAFLMSPRTRWGLAQLRDGVGRPYFEEEIDTKGTVMGVPFFTTSQIPNNLSGGGSGGSSESELTYVETSTVLLGIGLMPSIETSREGSYVESGTMKSAFSRDETLMRVILRADTVQSHNEGTAVVTGVTLQ